MVKIIYPLGKGSIHDNIELRWSLRSVAKFAKELPELVFVGHIPDFIDRSKCVCIDLEDSTDCKHKNIMNCLLVAIERLGLTEPFLMSSDDHFFVKPVDLSSYPVYVAQGQLPREGDIGSNAPIGRWMRSLIDTRNILEENGYSALIFHGHFDTWIFPEVAGDVIRLMNIRPEGRYGYEPTDMFVNIRTSRKGGLDIVYRRDNKFESFAGPDTMEKHIGRYDSFSIDDEIFDYPGFVEYMNGLYPNRSPWERQEALRNDPSAVVKSPAEGVCSSAVDLSVAENPGIAGSFDDSRVD